MTRPEQDYEAWVLGDFSPLSFIIRTYANGPDALFPFFPRRGQSGPPVGDNALWLSDPAAVIAQANFVHELTHLLQYSTRWFLYEHVLALANQARATWLLLRKESKGVDWPPAFKGAGGLGSLVPSVREVDRRTLTENLRKMVGLVQGVLDNLEHEKTAFGLETVEIEAGITADGRIGFLQSHLGANAHGTVKLVLRRAKRSSSTAG